MLTCQKGLGRYSCICASLFPGFQSRLELLLLTFIASKPLSYLQPSYSQRKLIGYDYQWKSRTENAVCWRWAKWQDVRVLNDPAAVLTLFFYLNILNVNLVFDCAQLYFFFFLHQKWQSLLFESEIRANFPLLLAQILKVNKENHLAGVVWG